MSSVVWAQPVATTPPPPLYTPEYTQLWTGADGITWDLNDWTSGVYLASGLVGMAHAPIERWTDDSPAMPGSRFRGARALARSVQWPIVITTKTSVGSWRDLARRWWRGWSKDTPGTWTVIDSGGESRSIDLLHNPSGDFSLGYDPGLFSWVPWTVDAVADFPYWRGNPITASWQQVTPAAFIPVTGAPPFTISSSASLTTAEIDNPGDVDAWPVWTITGPFDAISITVAGGTIIGPAVLTGQTVVVDTSPTNPVAIRNATTDVSGQFTAWDPRPVPAGGTVPITITGTGLGQVSVSLTPLYEMAF